MTASMPSGSRKNRCANRVDHVYLPRHCLCGSEYLPGGGGRTAANYLCGSARPDGLTIAHVSSGMVTSAVLGESGVQYDLDKFIWLGATTSAFH